VLSEGLFVVHQGKFWVGGERSSCVFPSSSPVGRPWGESCGGNGLVLRLLFFHPRLPMAAMTCLPVVIRRYVTIISPLLTMYFLLLVSGLPTCEGKEQARYMRTPEYVPFTSGLQSCLDITNFRLVASRGAFQRSQGLPGLPRAYFHRDSAAASSLRVAANRREAGVV
jgi:hypothetical protein